MKNNVIVGLDLGSRYLKLVIRERDSKIKGIELAKRPVSEGDLISLLQEWVKKYGIKGKSLFSSLSGPEINIQYFKLPLLSPKELTSAVQIEASQILGKELNEMDTDFYLLSKDKKGERILFVSCPKEISDQRISIIKKIGLKPAGLTLDSLALANIYMKEEKDSGATLLLNIGAQITNLAIVEKEKLLFIRDITWGGEKMAKEEEDFPKINSSEIEKASISLLEEVKKTLDYCQSTEKIKIKRLIVTGGAAQTPYLVEFLSKSLNLSLCKWQPLKKSGFALEEKERLEPFLAVAFGLSLES